MNVKHVFLVVFSLVVTFFIAETGARLFLWYAASPDQFGRYASLEDLRARYGPERLIPDRYLGFVTNPDFDRPPNKHNALGFRGDEIVLPKPDGVYRIVCLGGSTTYSEGVQDYRQTYPYLLGEYLRAEGHSEVEVINGGVPGYSSLETAINLQLRVLELEPDMIVIYHGINDVHTRFVWPPAAYSADNSGVWEHSGDSTMPPFWELSAVVRMVLVRFDLIESHQSLHRISSLADTFWNLEFVRQLSEGSYPQGIFDRISAETMLETNRPIYFERNIENIIALAEAHDVEVILSTFVYSAEFPGTTPYLGARVYQRALVEQNELLRRIAKEERVPLIDLARSMPVQKAHFTDGIHFSEAGHQLRVQHIGALISAHLGR